MKKIIVLILLSMVCLCSCGKKIDIPTISTEESSAPIDIPAAPTEVSLAPTGMPSAPTGVPQAPTEETIAIAPGPNWETAYLVDDFGDPTGDMCLQYYCEGTFSNSATISSDLAVFVFFTPAVSNEEMISSFAFRLLEYKDNPISPSSSDAIQIKVKIGDSISEDYFNFIPDNGILSLVNGLNIHSEMYKTLYNSLLESEENIRCIIEDGSSKYTFTLSGRNFVNAANEMMKSYGYDSLDVGKYPIE